MFKSEKYKAHTWWNEKIKGKLDEEIKSEGNDLIFFLIKLLCKHPLTWAVVALSWF